MDQIVECSGIFLLFDCPNYLTSAELLYIEGFTEYRISS